MALFVVLGGCVSVNGKLCGAWEAGTAEVTYSHDESLQGAAHLKVVVSDSSGVVYRGSAVSVSRSGDPASPHFVLTLNAEGTAEAAMPIGQWTVEVGYPSEKPLRKKVDLAPGQRCMIEMVLISHDREVVVASSTPPRVDPVPQVGVVGVETLLIDISERSFVSGRPRYIVSYSSPDATGFVQMSGERGGRHTLTQAEVAKLADLLIESGVLSLPAQGASCVDCTTWEVHARLNDRVSQLVVFSTGMPPLVYAVVEAAR